MSGPRNGPLVGIINYHMGNLGSVANALKTLNVRHVVSDAPSDLDRVDAVILPGVGAFGAAMANLTSLRFADWLRERVLARGTPFLGICLGMQLLAEDSTELGRHKGLGFVAGHVAEMPPSPGVVIPHVGWNTLDVSIPTPLFKGIDPDAHFYFDHSFHLDCAPDIVAAASRHGIAFTAAIARDNVLAVQFHPEKSQRNGLKLLRNFVNFVDTH